MKNKVIIISLSFVDSGISGGDKIFIEYIKNLIL